jgi:DNA-binding NarL/FixJ family response regulator
MEHGTLNRAETDRISIVVVDDDVHVLNDLSVLLDGYHRLVIKGKCKNCYEAIETISRESPQLLLLDLNLKEENGVDCIPVLLNASPSLKVIIYSNYYTPEKAAEAKHAGAKGYVVKNVQIDSLYSSILYVSEGGEVWPEEINNRNQYTRKNTHSSLLKFLKNLFFL